TTCPRVTVSARSTATRTTLPATLGATMNSAEASRLPVSSRRRSIGPCSTAATSTGTGPPSAAEPGPSSANTNTRSATPPAISVVASSAVIAMVLPDATGLPEGSSLDHAAKTDLVAVPLLDPEPVAIRAAKHLGHIAHLPAARHLAAGRIARPERIHRFADRVVVVRVPVRNPLLQVAEHVERTVGRGPRGPRTDRLGPVAVAQVARDHALAGQRIVAPRVHARVVAARRLLPLGLARQPPADPLAKVDRLRPAHAVDRVLLVAGRGPVARARGLARSGLDAGPILGDGALVLAD